VGRVGLAKKIKVLFNFRVLDFTTGYNSSQNLLYDDGEVYYYPNFLEPAKADFYFKLFLQNLNWKADEAIVFGKKIYTKRKIVWQADLGNESFGYSGVQRVADKWNSEVLELKKMVEKATSCKFNSCLLNLYHNGSEGMAWHTDNTKEFGKHTAIASISLGAERRFDFKHIKTGVKKSLMLENGSLLIMKGQTQSCWLHQVPKTAKIKTARISLTFRELVRVE
jgi:alkylated DNA repair dioxygenase AlkB